MDIGNKVLVGFLNLELVVGHDEEVADQQAVVVVVRNQVFDRQLLRQLKHQLAVLAHELLAVLGSQRRRFVVDLRLGPKDCELEQLQHRLVLNLQIEHWDLVNAGVEQPFHLPIGEAPFLARVLHHSDGFQCLGSNQVPSAVLSRERSVCLHRLVCSKRARRDDAGINMGAQRVKFVEAPDELFFISNAELCEGLLIGLQDENMRQDPLGLYISWVVDGVLRTHLLGGKHHRSLTRLRVVGHV